MAFESYLVQCHVAEDVTISLEISNLSYPFTRGKAYIIIHHEKMRIV